MARRNPPAVDDRRYNRPPLTRQHQLRYQVFVDRGNGPECDWAGLGGDAERWSTRRREAQDFARHLRRLYPDCAWIVADVDGQELERF